MSHDLASHILENVKLSDSIDVLDKPIWSLETRGEFTVKSAWEFLRSRRDTAITYKNMWVKGLSFKISFFMWKLWRGKLPLDDPILRMGYCMPS